MKSKADIREEKLAIIKDLILKLRTEFGIRINLKETMEHKTDFVALTGVNGIKFLSGVNYDTAILTLEKMYEKNKNLVLNLRKMEKEEYKREYENVWIAEQPTQSVLI